MTSPQVARILITASRVETTGVGITVDRLITEERDQSFAKPVSLEVANKLANTILSPFSTRVRAFDIAGSLCGEWSFNEQLTRAIQEKQTRGIKASEPKSPQEKAMAKALAAVKKKDKEREELAKAPRVMLPFYKSGENNQKTGFRKQCDRWVAPIPMVEADQKITITLTRNDGTRAIVPIYKGLYQSAVSRGKADKKLDEKADLNLHVKRLIAEVLLTHELWVSALLVSHNQELSLTREQALNVQKAPKSDQYKRKQNAVAKKKPTPFGTTGFGWRGRCKQDRSCFSNG